MRGRGVVGAAVVLVLALGVAWWAGAGGDETGAQSLPAARDERRSPEAGSNRETPLRRPPTVEESAGAQSPSASPLPAPVDLEAADRDLDLHGIVVDGEDHPVAGARIAAITHPWHAMVLESVDIDAEIAGPRTRTSVDGTFALRLARGTTTTLRVAAEGFAPVEIPMCAAGERMRVVLRPGVRLVVALTDELARPVAGAPLHVFNSDLDGGSLFDARGESGADGTCVFTDLPGERWGWIDAEPALGKCAWVHFVLPASGELRKEIRVPTGRTLTGRVVDDATGEGLAGARVGMTRTLAMETRTAADGSFTLSGWTTGVATVVLPWFPGVPVVDVHVRAEGYAPDSRRVGDADRLEFRLERGFAAVGRVVDPEGRPVGGALVGLAASEFVDGHLRVSDAGAATDAAGDFRLTCLRRDMEHVLVVVAAGHARLRRVVPTPREGADLDLGEIRLSSPLRLEGRVLDADGGPVARVAVIADGPIGHRDGDGNGEGEGDGEGEGEGDGDGEGNDENDDLRAVVRRTDDLGRFRFTDLSPGAYRVTVVGPVEVGAGSDVTLTDRDVTDLVIRRAAIPGMPPRAATRELLVRVVDDTGAAVPGLDVEAYGEHGELSRGRTDARGEVRLRILPSQPDVVVRVGDADLLDPDPVEISADQTEVTCTVVRSAMVTGRVLGPDGAPIVGASVSVEAADSTAGDIADSDGRFRAWVPRAGRVDVVFEGVVHRRGEIAVLRLGGRLDGVEPGSDVVLRCEPVAWDRQLVVVVQSQDGDPAAGMLVLVEGAAGQVTRGRTGAAGRVTIDGLPPRSVQVSVQALGDAAVLLPPRPVWAMPAGQEIVVECSPAVPLRGIALDAEGRPASGDVCCLLDGGFVSQSPVEADGSFAVPVPVDEAGPFRVELLSRFQRVVAAADDVRPGGPEVRLVAPGK